MILKVKVGLFLTQTALSLREPFSIFRKNAIDAIDIAQAIAPPTYIGSLKLKLAKRPPKSEPIGIAPQTKVLRVP